MNPISVLQWNRNAQLLLHLISERHQKLDIRDHRKHILKLCPAQVLAGNRPGPRGLGPLRIKRITWHIAFCHFWELD